MANDTQLNGVSVPGGDKVRNIDRGAAKTQVVILDLNTGGAETLFDASAGLPVQAASLPLPTGAATEATLDARTGSLTETAPATDTASSGINGRLQRIAQRITSLIALIPAALTGSGNFKVAVQEALPAGANAIGSVSVSASALPTGAATEATLDARTGALTETAPATDTASSGLNGRLQRIAQRITSLIALIPAALTGSGNFKVALVESTASQAVTNAGTFAVQDSQKVVDNAGFTDGTTPVQPVAGIFDESAGTALTENDVAAARVDSKRAWVQVLEDATTRGQRQTVDSGGAALVKTLEFGTTISVDITRPSDTIAYSVDDALSNSTSSPTAGGFTLASATRGSGKSGVLLDLLVFSSNPGTLQGEIVLFNQAVTNINDNATFAITDSEVKTMVGIIPFTLRSFGNNSAVHIQNINSLFTTVGTADLRFLVRVKTTYTPVSVEVITVEAHIIQLD